MSDSNISTPAFWVVEKDWDGHGAQFGSPKARTGEYSAVARDIFSGRLKPQSPLEFEHARKSRLYDLLWSGYGGLNLVSSPFVQCLSEIGATGWSTVPARLMWKGREDVPGYSILVVTGRAGPWTRRRSKREVQPALVSWGHPYEVLRGLWFDERTWDGSDVFALGNRLDVLVTDRVATALRRAKLKGIVLTPQSEWWTPV